VVANRKSLASAHITEDGYVKHRVLELRKLAVHQTIHAA
jgi:hypothetical protein